MRRVLSWSLAFALVAGGAVAVGCRQVGDEEPLTAGSSGSSSGSNGETGGPLGAFWPCASTTECAVGLACVYRSDDTAPRCRPLCTSDDECPVQQYPDIACQPLVHVDGTLGRVCNEGPSFEPAGSERPSGTPPAAAPGGCATVEANTRIPATAPICYRDDEFDCIPPNSDIPQCKPDEEVCAPGGTRDVHCAPAGLHCCGKGACPKEAPFCAGNEICTATESCAKTLKSQACGGLACADRGACVECLGGYASLAEIDCIDGRCLTGDGAPCVDAAACASGAGCVRGLCGAAKGGYCDTALPCGTNLFCVNNHCSTEPMAPIGTPKPGGSGGSGADACATACPNGCKSEFAQACYYCQAACIYRCYGDSAAAQMEAAKACKLGTCGC